MKLNIKMNSVAAAVALAIGLSTPAFAQEITSAIRGVVTTEAGQVVSNATVTLTDTRNGTSTTLETNDTGTFSTRNLAVGGPYTLTVTSEDGNSEVITGIYLTVGDTQNINVALSASSVERIAVTGTLVSNSNYGGKAPAANFSLRDLETAPAANRDLKDLIAIDPRVYVDESFGDGVQCVGASPRFNSLTLDGVRTNDNFGLNSNGYPTERMPFSYDAIEQVAVEFSPFDVKYGGFTACNINAVTKSGSNELEGGVFYDFTSDSFRGDEIEDTTLDNGNYTEKRYGFNVGFPLIKDSLFLFTAYEKYEGADRFARGAGDDPNAGVPVLGVTQAQLDEIARIARDVYGYEPGSPIASSPVEDEKLLMKIDWYINDDHRLALTYNYNSGGSIAESDGDNDEYEFSNHYYNSGANYYSYAAQVYSNWTNNFQTEFRAGYSKLDNIQENIGTQRFPEAQIITTVGDNEATVYLGVDDSRQSNDLNYDTTFFKLAGTYSVGDHVVLAGLESETVDVFNMFVQHSIGEYRFESIADFEAGVADYIQYGTGAGTNNPRDAAGSFKYTTNTAYVQDEYYFYEYDLTITAGLRYDWYSTDDIPRENPFFEQRYGYSNAASVDGKGLLQPRVGFNWMATPELEMRGGVGLYSGGNPNVWVVNAYQNNGFTQFQNRYFPNGMSVFDMQLSGEGRPLYDIPQEAFDDAANAQPRDADIQSIAPNFKLPKEWKYALGGTYTFDTGYVVMADLMYSKREDAPYVRNLASELVGEFADGRPQYAFTNGYFQDYQLANLEDGGDSLSFTTSVSKRYDWGLDWSFAYAYTDATDAAPMTSSTAGSNYGQAALTDLGMPGVGTSNYEIPHRFTLRATYRQEFFDGYETIFSLFGTANKGRPYSYTFAENRDLEEENSIFGDSYSGRQLLYVPTGLDDNNVVFAPGFDSDAFFSFLESSGLNKYAGGIAPRNAFYSDWWTKFNFRVEQQLPGFHKDHKASVFFVVENLGNLLNKDWGVLYQAGFPQYQGVARTETNAQGQYVLTDFISPNPQSRVLAPSLWEVKLGVQYKF